MSRERAPSGQRAAAASLRAAATLLAALPVRVAYAAADAAAPALRVWLSWHERRVAPLGRGMRRNLRIAYRERLTPDAERRLLRAWTRHATRLVVDCARLTRIGSADLERVVDVRDLEIVGKLVAEGGGLICVSGHIGVWELCAHASSLHGLPLTTVARALPGPLERVAAALRGAGGERLIEQRGALWRLVRALRRGEMVGFLADEDYPERPVFAPFLGTLAATSPVAAFLQRASGAPIAVVTVHRTGRWRFRLRVWDVIRRADGVDAETHLRDTTAAVNAALSRAIEAHPEQWLWGARRFRTRPPGETPGPDGLPPPAPAGAAAVR